MYKGKKTLLYALLVVSLGGLEAAEQVILPDQGYMLMAVGVGIAVLRVVTTSSVFKS